MPLLGLLSTGGAALVYLALLVPVLLAVVRRRWRAAARRSEEVRRLLLLASEESARAEFESAREYRLAVAAAAAAEAKASETVAATASVSVQAVPERICAFCQSPTNKLCSGCKAVRYCSGKCQISHWFQGHRDVCRSPSITSHHNGTGNDSILKESAKQVEQSVKSGIPVKADDRDAKRIGSFQEKPIQQPSSSFNNTNGINDVKVDPVLDNVEANRNSTSSTVSSSAGYFTPDISVDKHNMVNSPVKAVEVSSNDVSHSQNIASSSASVDVSDGYLSKSPITKFKYPVSSVDVASVSNNSKKKLASADVGEVDHRSNGESGTSVSASGRHAVVGEYQDANHPSHRVRSARHLDSDQPEFHKKGNGFPVDFVSTSQFSAENSGQSDDSYANSGTEKCSVGSSSAEKVVLSPSRPKDIRDTDLGRPASFASGRINNEHQSKSRESRSLSFRASADHVTSTDGGISISKGSPWNSDSVQAVSASISAAMNSSQSGGYELKTSLRKVAQQFKMPKLSKNPLAFGSENNGKYNDKILFQYELFVKLYSDKVELRPCGLINCGNSCYANVVLQCLTFTRPLNAYFLQGFHSKTCPKKDWCFMCEFESLVSKAKEGKSPLSPKGILSQLHNFGGNLSQGKEEDAHEFLRHAIDAMQSACLKEAGVNAIGSLAEGTTLMQLTFGGYLRSKIKCMTCLGKSERRERMMDLTVEINGDVGTLEEALRRFTATETLDGDNKYLCSRCKSYEKAKKKLTVLEAPNILTIALKRFQSGKFGKLNKPVQFPVILDMGPFMDMGATATNDKSPVYSLYAVVVHLDIMNASFSGHYVCYVKTNQNKWYKIDDSTVKPVELEKVLSIGAYMLLYARCSPRAPNIIRKLLSHDQSRISSRPPPAHHRPEKLYNRPASEAFDYLNRRFDPIRKKGSSSSDSSLLSSSEEGSCSTDSTRDSTSTEDSSEQTLGDSGRFSSWNGSDGYASSPVSAGGSVSNGNMSDSPKSGYSISDFRSSGDRGLNYDTESPPFLDSDRFRYRVNRRL
ncbi:Ubiquitin carboxyl-terminal hydrolase 16 [Acorus calamus]|uniref:ubiquitinyl hydrolase 1 n=1 Tax=Acorus calamus TaxID=4465 RepID=A0AAV9DQ30_ACOCL|nr:Ubiquitin carboxyl-terminal hydrolase 16 [Acorus calamus]